MVNYWIFPVKYTGQDGLKGYKRRMKEKTWRVNFRPTKSLEPNDKIVFYLTKQNNFLGTAVAASKIEDTEQGLFVELKEIDTWESPKSIRPLIDALKFITDKKNWGLDLHKSIVDISPEEYQIIIQKSPFDISLQQGQELKNQDIAKIFKCASQGGMRRSNKTNSLVLISDHTKKYYKDSWDDQGKILFYTGMGQKGDQKLSFAQNKTLSESNTNSVKVFLFEVFEEGKYIYIGQVKLSAQPYQESQRDIEGNSRKVWIFPLKLINNKPNLIIPEEIFFKEQKQKQEQSKGLSDEELLKRAKAAKKKPAKQSVRSTQYIRDPNVAECVRRRADGKCELCNNEAPFNNSKNEPFLEEHHIVWLSKGGEDTIDNAVALCPNCHRKMHILHLKKDEEKLKSATKKVA